MDKRKAVLAEEDNKRDARPTCIFKITKNSKRQRLGLPCGKPACIYSDRYCLQHYRIVATWNQTVKENLMEVPPLSPQHKNPRVDPNKIRDDDMFDEPESELGREMVKDILDFLHRQSQKETL